MVIYDAINFMVSDLNFILPSSFWQAFFRHELHRLTRIKSVKIREIRVKENRFIHVIDFSPGWPRIEA
jgi:hypothetical protein